MYHLRHRIAMLTEKYGRHKLSESLKPYFLPTPIAISK
jgi:hypothetical protein